MIFNFAEANLQASTKMYLGQTPVPEDVSGKTGKRRREERKTLWKISFTHQFGKAALLHAINDFLFWRKLERYWWCCTDGVLAVRGAFGRPAIASARSWKGSDLFSGQWWNWQSTSWTRHDAATLRIYGAYMWLTLSLPAGWKGFEKGGSADQFGRNSPLLSITIQSC